MIPKIIHYCWFGGNPLPELAQRCIASWQKFLPDYEIWQWTEGNGDSEAVRNGAELLRNADATKRFRYEKDNGNVNVNVNQESVSETQPSALSPQPSALSVERLSVIENQPSAVSEDGIKLFDRVMTFDVNIIPYTAEAYRQKKYAFVSDYARFWIMYKYGGIYFDTDVEVIRPINDIISRGNFMGFEQDPDGENTPGKYAPRYCFGVNPGVGFGITKEHPFMKQMMDLYATLKFQPVPENIAWYKTIVAYTTEELCRCGLKNVKGIQDVLGIHIYPRTFFSPINVVSGKLRITEQTHSIHRFTSTWSDNKCKSIKGYLRHYLPEWVFYLHNRIKRRRYRI